MVSDLTDEYRARAAAAPWDHRIPWNCPTFYDGCNCRETVRALDPKVRSMLQEEAYELRHARAVREAWDELEADLARAIELLDALAGREFLDDYVGPNRDAHEWLVEYGRRRG